MLDSLLWASINSLIPVSFWWCSTIFLIFLNLFINFWKWLLHWRGVLVPKYSERVLKTLRFLWIIESLLSLHFWFEHLKMMIDEENIFYFLIFWPFAFHNITSLWVFWFLLTTFQIFWMRIAGDILILRVVRFLYFSFHLLTFRVLHLKKILLITEI